VISCSKTAPETSSTTRAQTEVPLGGAAMKSVSTPHVAMAKLAPMSVSVGAAVPSLVTSCQLAWVFGERISAKDPDRQTAEIQIRVALMNRFNALGTAEIVRVA
jgi:hypothetical protein